MTISIFTKTPQFNEIVYDLPPYFPGEKDEMLYVTIRGKYKLYYKLRIHDQGSPYILLLPGGPGGDHNTFT